MDAVQVKKLAELARLEVPESELVAVAKGMDAIIGFVDEIQQVSLNDAGDAKPFAQNVFREDVVAPIASVHNLVEAAPSYQDGFVKVPKVIE